MDDFPAGPASPEPRRFALSVVIPVHNGGDDFELCLRRLRDSSYRNFELIVVDDGSTDRSARLAESFGAQVHHHGQPLGPAAARNLGARAASGSIIFFLDADVAVHPSTLLQAMTYFEADTQLAALFGSYDDAPSAEGIVSRYRNLLHHYTHQQGDFTNDARVVHTFWTGCGAIRRETFLALGGFDPQRYRRPAIEDIELGYRIRRAGGEILLVRNLLATHLKRWSLRQVLRTDIFCRGVPWMLLIKRSQLPETDLNVSHDQKICVALTAIGAISLGASPILPPLVLGWLASLALIAWLNRDFYRFLRAKQGTGFAIAGFALHYLYFWCCGLSVLIAMGLWHAKLKHEPRPSLTGIRLDVPDQGLNPAQTNKRHVWRATRWNRRIARLSRSSKRTGEGTQSRRPSA